MGPLEFPDPVPRVADKSMANVGNGQARARLSSQFTLLSR